MFFKRHLTYFFISNILVKRLSLPKESWKMHELQAHTNQYTFLVTADWGLWFKNAVFEGKDDRHW